MLALPYSFPHSKSNAFSLSVEVLSNRGNVGGSIGPGESHVDTLDHEESCYTGKKRIWSEVYRLFGEDSRGKPHDMRWSSGDNH